MRKIILIIIVLVIILAGVALILSSGLLKIPYTISYTVYKVKIVNNSNFEITDIRLTMVGVEKGVSVDKLGIGEGTEYYKFLLKKAKKGGVVQISYGDFKGSYKQGGIEKRIFIPRPKKIIDIIINDSSFSVR